MKYEERERMLDRLLDEALSPQPVEPRPGLEQRILAGLQAQPAPRPWWHWAWVPVAAAIIIALGLYITRRPQPAASPLAHTTAAPVLAPASTAKPVQPAVVAHKRISRARRHTEPQMAAVANTAPRLETFPARTSITPEEQLLRAFVQRQRNQAQEVAEAQAQREEKIRRYFDTGELADNGHGGTTK